MQTRMLLNLKSISFSLLLVIAILGNGNCYASLDSWRTHSMTITHQGLTDFIPLDPIPIDPIPIGKLTPTYYFLLPLVEPVQNMQPLIQEQSVSITIEPFETAFSLGNELSGNFQVTLAPTSLSNSNHSLQFVIADRKAPLVHASNGMALFEAEHGIDYYVFLEGFIMSDQSYNLQLTQVPLPASIWFLGIGLAGLLSYKRPYKQIRV